MDKARIQNIVVKIVTDTNHVSYGKLLRLLYFIDLQSFVSTYWTMTNFQWLVGEYGPTLSDAIIDELMLVKHNMYRLQDVVQCYDNLYVTDKKFDDTYFSQVDIECMDAVLSRYKNSGMPAINDEILFHKGMPYKTSRQRNKSVINFAYNFAEYYGTIALDNLLDSRRAVAGMRKVLNTYMT